MNAIILYTKRQGQATSYEFNVFDNQFATENLAVRKVLMSMLESVRDRLTDLEVEYNDSMLAEKLGAKRAGETLRFLGATRENSKEHLSNGIVVSRSFQAPMTPERYAYFYELTDIAQLSHYRLKEGDEDRIVFYFTRYLQLIAPDEQASQIFLQKLAEFSLPYKLVPIS
ncbi:MULTISPECIES: hypothetical protein [Brevibacillus]|uniref:hypothetical protein n=1 Tax=Brevibacillus TaxID=55080 RepID=UPI0007AB4C3F|nr:MULTISPECIES: hypothetical protein [Brevibacillus]KZE52457.1 hypothetical protein AV540_11405 [Brevibacillus parabrevis]MBU8714332.1 hypothetical protein [Brevibacillus parabrevis]MDR4998825.1 hypothetical protein [Brevibacillus parabrevis]NRQ57096.1 hypothetical protein [Brevibacillus sp. HD1.4A]UED67548.1 hypothetical protein HP435_20015 [Brevibacillus sp. HD3.3A]